MSFFDTPDSFASTSPSGFSNGGDSFASSPSNFSSSVTDTFASSGSNSTGFGSPSPDNFAQSKPDSFATSKKDSFANTDTTNNGDSFSNTGKSSGFLGFLRKTFDAFASSSSVDDAFATGALDDAFATDRHEKELAKFKAWYGTVSTLDIKNIYGNNPTTIITGIGYGRFGNKLK